MLVLVMVGGTSTGGPTHAGLSLGGSRSGGLVHGPRSGGLVNTRHQAPDTRAPRSGGLVKRLISQREELVQPGLSYINSSSPLLTPMTLGMVTNLACKSQVHLLFIFAIFIHSLTCSLRLQYASCQLHSFGQRCLILLVVRAL